MFDELTFFEITWTTAILREGKQDQYKHLGDKQFHAPHPMHQDNPQ
jgi:hypothetical protein